jgi:hypothetical protein
MVKSLSAVASVGNGREKIAGKVGFKVIASLIALNRINHLQFLFKPTKSIKKPNIYLSYYKIQVGFETTNGDSTLEEHLPLHPKVKGSNPVPKICTRGKMKQ